MRWDELLADCVDFAQRLIRTPSMPHEESAVSALIIREMEMLGFDEVWQDGAGNACGRIFGRDRSLGALVLNSHMDHVDAADESLWPAPPFAAEIIDGRVHGRGACDIKGPLAVQIYSMAALLRWGQRPYRDVVFSGVVEEEVGGAGAVYWIDHLDYPVDLIVLGEPSSNHLSLGHRGILQMWVTFAGRSVHASVPSEGHNPNYDMARFLSRLQDMSSELTSHPLLGPTTVAPTLLEVDTKSLNVTPAWTRVLLDFRTAAESTNSLREFVSRVAGGLDCRLSDAWASDPDQPLHESDETIYGYYTPPDSQAVHRIRALVTQGMGWEPDLVSYRFATDGRHFVKHGIPIIGYSAGEEHLAHTVLESISIDMMAESLRGHFNLLRDY
jgi:succinyl-diaminopimelate desuccinylase